MKAVSGKKFAKLLEKHGWQMARVKRYFDSLVETTMLLFMPGLYQSIQKANEQIAKKETYSIDEIFGDELTIYS